MFFHVIPYIKPIISGQFIQEMSVAKIAGIPIHLNKKLVQVNQKKRIL